MIISEAIYEECENCGKQHLVEERILGCDKCGDKVFYKDGNALGVCVFYTDESEKDYRDYTYCSWGCFIRDVANIDIENAEFVSLPDIGFDEKTPCKQGWQAFLAILCQCHTKNP